MRTIMTVLAEVKRDLIPRRVATIGQEGKKSDRLACLMAIVKRDAAPIARASGVEVEAQTGPHEHADLPTMKIV
jgi:hypothetical protein